MKIRKTYKNKLFFYKLICKIFKTFNNKTKYKLNFKSINENNCQQSSLENFLSCHKELSKHRVGVLFHKTLLRVCTTHDKIV